MSDKKKILMKNIVVTISTLATFILAFFLLSGTEHYTAMVVVVATAAFAALVSALVVAAVFADLASATVFALVSAATFTAASAAASADTFANGNQTTFAATAFAALVAATVFALVSASVDVDNHNKKFVISCFIGEVIFISGIISAIIFL